MIDRANIPVIRRNWRFVPRFFKRPKLFQKITERREPDSLINVQRLVDGLFIQPIVLDPVACVDRKEIV